MIEIDVPELRMAEVQFVPDARQLRGPGSIVPDPPLDGLASMGVPVVVGLDDAYLAQDPELAAFVASQQPTYRFALVHLAVTFRPDRKDLSPKKAWAMFSLNAPASAIASAPIVWSMQPDRLETEEKIPSTVKLGAKLSLVELTGERSTIETRRTTTVEAFGLQETRATWEFSAGGRPRLLGSQRLALVTRLPPEPCTGAFDLRLQVQQRRFGLFSADAQFEAGEGTIAI